MISIKEYFQRPDKSDWLIIAGYWIIALFFIAPAYFINFPDSRAFGAIVFNIIIDTTFILILIYTVLPYSLRNKNYLLPIASVIVLLTLTMVISKLGYGFILKRTEKWGFNNILFGIIDRAQSFGILLSVLAMKKFYSSQQNIAELKKANAESNLKVLSNQIAPHFLFNNLNVLQSLIKTDADLATEYVNHLSSLYRYLIRHKDDDVVMLKDEMGFADDYIFLLTQRFGDAYKFEIKITNEAALNKLVPSCCLQVLLENIVKHNQGNTQKPLITFILINEDDIIVKNRIDPKILPAEASGTGLQNLLERYQLLSSKNIIIKQGLDYSVTLPLINHLKSF
jgi:two-component system, LytTR family, sensor kinase